MDARTRSTYSSLTAAFGLFAAVFLTALWPDPAAAQTAIAPEPALAEVVAEQDRTEAPVVNRAVVTNAEDVERLARRWYRSLDGSSTLGGGSVVVYARVLADGSVAEAFVPAAAPHHPALNGLGRRLAMKMRFAPVDAHGAPIGTEALGASGYWVAQRIVFRR